MLVFAALAAAPVRPVVVAPPAPAESAGVSTPGRLLVPGRTAHADTAGRARTERARQLYEQGRSLENIHAYAAAVTAYSQAVRLDPTIRDAAYRMGLLFAQAGALRQAIGAFSSEVERNPGHLAAARELGLALSRYGDHRRAIRQLRLLTDRLPDDGATWRALGFAYMQAGRPADAERALRRAIALPPDAADEHRDLGHVLATTGREREAREEYRRAIALDPAEAGSWVNLGNLERAAGDPAKALADYDQAVKRDSSLVPAWKARGQVLLEQRRMADAGAAYRRLVELTPGDEESRMIAIRLFAGLDRADIALQVARDGVRYDERSGPARLMLGMALEATGDMRSAARELRRAEAFSADSTARAQARSMIDVLSARAPAALLPELAADSARVAAEKPPAPARRDSSRGRTPGDALH